MALAINSEPIEIFLQPGEFCFGNSGIRIRTVLGSCVSIVMWHRLRRIGGMCHFMLPDRRRQADGGLDGRYAVDAVLMFLHEIANAETVPAEYEVKLFGGGQMFKSVLDVGGHNIEAARRLLRQHGFDLHGEHLAGKGHRHVIFDVGSGQVLLRHVAETLQAGTIPN